MQAYVGVTDFDWFRNLSAIPNIDEVNFWKPGGHTAFKALSAGELFLFKLKAPRNVVVGGGFFAHFSILPCSLAWDAFGRKNGVNSLANLREKVEELRRVTTSLDDYDIGCILLEQPFFFPESDWFEPPDFQRNTVQGRTYDLGVPPGIGLWEDVRERLTRLRSSVMSVATAVAESKGPRFGNTIEITPRLGQGSFRIIVTDAYGRRCAASGERTLPVLEAAHIKPYSLDGEHQVNNGLLLRSDLHTLYDLGYLTVTPKYQIEVSRRIREEFENGRAYYALDGRTITLPSNEENRPSASLLEWHAGTVFRG